MRGKVSIVVPCYNKEQYIGATLQSVLAQIWDNIELIFVNDGSTDGTRAVIEEFVPKILARGYEYKIIDQGNRGLAGAIKEGLRHISGEYCCLIDSDDEILPEYVSLRAEFLDMHPEYEWAACDIGVCDDPRNPHLIPQKSNFPDLPGRERMMESFILYRVIISASPYLVRTSYLRQCKVAERFYVSRGGNQEAQFVIPLAEGRGKLKYFPQVLYKYNRYASEHSKTNTPEEVRRYVEVLGTLYHKTVDTLEITDTRREYLHGLCDLFEGKLMVRDLLSLDDKPALAGAASRLCELAKRQLSAHTGAEPDRLLRAGLPVFIHALEYVALGLRNPCLDEFPSGRVIGYGALGQVAQSLLPALEGTPLQPELLWDQGGPSVSVIGQAVTPPNLDALGPGNLILLLPRHPDIAAEMMPVFESKGCRVLKYFDILDALSAVYFGDLMNTARFLPGGGAR